MFKKIISLAIALMIVMSMAAIAVSAAQVEISENAADTPAEVGAEGGAEVGAEGGADTGAEGGADTSASGSKIYFDASTTGWNNYSIIMVYCYEPETGDIQIDWAAKKKGGMVNEGNDIWSYDFSAKNITIDPNKQYAIIFNADTGAQTCDLLMDSTCFGDTATCEKDNLIGSISGGQKKRVSIGIELAADPALFFLDEPDSGLDGPTANGLMEQLRTIADLGKIVMVITHSPDRAFHLFTKVIVLGKTEDNVGHLLFFGTPAQALDFFETDKLESIVRRINRPSEGGEGLADHYYSLYTQREAEHGS